MDVTITPGAAWPDHVAVLRGAEVRCYSLRGVKARRVIRFNRETDYATGHCECGVCHGAVDFWDAYCRHCGVEFGEDE